MVLRSSFRNLEGFGQLDLRTNLCDLFSAITDLHCPWFPFILLQVQLFAFIYLCLRSYFFIQNHFPYSNFHYHRLPSPYFVLLSSTFIYFHLSSSNIMYPHIDSSFIYHHLSSSTFTGLYFRSYIFIYYRLPSSTIIGLYCPLLTLSVYPQIQLLTFIYHHIPSFTFTSCDISSSHLIHLLLPSFTSIFIYRPFFAFICFSYLNLPSSS